MITTNRHGNVIVVTLQGKTDLNLGVLDEQLFAAFEDYARDPELRCAVITGAGERAFSAGADLTALSTSRFNKPFWNTPPMPILMDADFPKPLIAAVNGHAIGAGMMIAMACDIRIASKNATFGLPEVKYGFPPALGATQRLVRLLPRGPALEMLLTGERISAAQAEQWGFVNRTVEQGDLLPAALDLAEKIAGNSPIAVRAARELARRATDLPLEHGLRLEAALSALARQTEDAAEGQRALLEKRKADFRGV